MNPFENLRIQNQTYNEDQDRKLKECMEKALELGKNMDALDLQHKKLLFDWAKKTVVTKEFINFIKNNFQNL